MRTPGAISRFSRRQLAATARRSISRMAFARSAARAATLRSEGIGQAVAADVIVEFGGVAVEAQRHLADRAVPLLGDVDFGEAVDLLAALSVLLDTVVVFFLAFFRPLR